MMSGKDQLKVIKAGFTIIRADQHNLLIKKKDNENTNWSTFVNGFPSKAALKRKMDELLKNSNYLED